MIVLPSNVKKFLSVKIWPFNKELKDRLAATPDKYKNLITDIYKESPIWGSHQTITFPDGFVLNGGRDESRKAKFNLPDDLTDMSVIDIGCNIGSICLECKKRNASTVVGLDKNTKLLKSAREIAKIFDFNIDYREFNIMTDNIDREYDIVFFLNVFHHLSEQGRVKILKTLERITKKYMYFEAPDKGDRIAKNEKAYCLQDYMSYLKGFTTFNRIEFLGKSDFNRPIIKCSR